MLSNFTKPNKTLDETKFVFEPVTGTPMKADIRFQINIKLERINNLTGFDSLPEISFVPHFWFESSMKLPHALRIHWGLSSFSFLVTFLR